MSPSLRRAHELMFIALKVHITGMCTTHYTHAASDAQYNGTRSVEPPLAAWGLSSRLPLSAAPPFFGGRVAFCFAWESGRVFRQSTCPAAVLQFALANAFTYWHGNARQCWWERQTSRPPTRTSRPPRSASVPCCGPQVHVCRAHRSPATTSPSHHGEAVPSWGKCMAPQV